MDLLRGRWLDKVGLWERRLGQVRLWRRWLDKIRGRLPEYIQLQTRWPGRIYGRWVPKNNWCRQMQFTKVLRFPMGFQWNREPGTMTRRCWVMGEVTRRDQVVGTMTRQYPETAIVQPLPDVWNEQFHRMYKMNHFTGCIKWIIFRMYKMNHDV